MNNKITTNCKHCNAEIEVTRIPLASGGYSYFSTHIKCKDCKNQLEPIDTFPGQLCLYCYDKKTKNDPITMPDFTKTIKI